MSSEQILGIAVIARHGDRSGFFQDPATYTASDTSITPLGLRQENDLGNLVRSIYYADGSPKKIANISSAVDGSQIKVRADTGDEGGVIFDSSIAFLQGLYPPDPSKQTIVLANGTSVTSPLGGYQYVPIESVEESEDVSLEGFAQCTAWNSRVSNIYNSSVFAAKAQEAAPFLQAIKPFLDSRQVTLQNAYNVFDFVNVQSLHNATFLKDLPSSFLPQARDLANWHENILFTDPMDGGIGNIAGATILPSILTGLQNIANSSNPLKVHYSAISYKPFISLFNMTGVTVPQRDAGTDQLGGIVNYASSLLIEVVQPASGDVGVRMFFKNGTNDANFNPLSNGVLGSSGIIPLQSFVSTLRPMGINNTLDWCMACNNHVDRGCAAFFSSNASSSSSLGDAKTCGKVSDVGAGFIGAGVTLALVIGLLGAAFFFGLIRVGSGTKSRAGSMHSGEMSAKQ